MFRPPRSASRAPVSRHVDPRPPKQSNGCCYVLTSTRRTERASVRAVEATTVLFFLGGADLEEPLTARVVDLQRRVLDPETVLEQLLELTSNAVAVCPGLH